MWDPSQISMRERRKQIHTISLLCTHQPGVLLRISLIFARRGFNIESLVVSSALDGAFARMTITAQGDKDTLEQIIKQLNKLIDVVMAVEHLDRDAIERELALIKVKVSNETRTEILQICDHFKATSRDITDESIIIEVTGATDKVDAVIDMLIKYGIIEVIRSGKMLMARGAEKT